MMKCIMAFMLGAMALSNPGTAAGLSAVALHQDQAQSPAESVVLRSGTEVKLVFAQSVSSKHATKGEKVELRVAEDVLADGTVVVPAGARVLGTVVQGKKNEKYGNSKGLAVSVDYIVVRDKRIRLTGERQQKAKTNIGAATVATMGLGLSGLMIYMNQRETWIREGAPAKGYVAEDVVFTQPELLPAGKM